MRNTVIYVLQSKMKLTEEQRTAFVETRNKYLVGLGYHSAALARAQHEVQVIFPLSCAFFWAVSSLTQLFTAYLTFSNTAAAHLRSLLRFMKICNSMPLWGKCSGDAKMPLGHRKNPLQ